MRVLLIEDEDANIKLWDDHVRLSHGPGAGLCIETEHAKSLEQATKMLVDRHYDAAVVDLRLKSPKSTDSDGMDFVTVALEMKPLCVAIFSGQTQDVDIPDVHRSRIEVIKRSEGVASVTKWLGLQTELIADLNHLKLKIEAQTARVFYQSLWPRWKKWRKVESTARTEAVVRHTIAHLHDQLVDPQIQLLSEECYFAPPIVDDPITGDLVQMEDGVWVILTPRCDLARPKADVRLLLAKCDDIGEEYQQADRKRRQQYIKHDGNRLQVHFLHSFEAAEEKQHGPFLVKFQLLKSLKVDTPLKRIASLAPQLVPSLIHRFGACMGRIGVPELSDEGK